MFMAELTYKGIVLTPLAAFDACSYQARRTSFSDRYFRKALKFSISDSAKPCAGERPEC
jgi:hypothetical protein